MNAPSLPAGASLDAFQRDFAAALLGDADQDPDRPLPDFARQPGFAVYRNTTLAACIDALVANHPTVRQIVGEAWLESAAGAFVREHPPSTGSLADYGAGLADFLAGFGSARALPYLADVARLDRLWIEAHSAPDGPVLAPAEVGRLGPEELLRAVLVPHPAARWLSVAESAAFTIWRRHRDGDDVGAELGVGDESGLLTRPHGIVEWQAIDAASVAFLDACAAGRTLAEAAARAGESAVVAALPQLLAAGAFTRLDR